MGPLKKDSFYIFEINSTFFQSESAFGNWQTEKEQAVLIQIELVDNFGFNTVVWMFGNYETQHKKEGNINFQISKLRMNRLYMPNIFVFNSFLRCKLAFCDFLGWHGLWVSGNHETQHKKEGNIIKSANKVDTRWIIAVFPALLPGTSQSVSHLQIPFRIRIIDLGLQLYASL